MGQVLNRGPRSGASRGGNTMEAEIHVDNELAKIREFSEGDRWGLVRRSWVDGSEERIRKPSPKIHLRR